MDLVRLLRSRLAAYRPFLTAVVVLQFVGVVAMLYLPSLNADIIDQGVATGDTDYIIRTGAVMLAVSLVQIVCAVSAVWFGAVRRWVSAATSAPRCSTGSARSPPARCSSSAPRR